jgi:hypothetical protein
MTKTAVGLFETSATADAVVALLLASGFSLDEVKLVKRTDFDLKPAPDTDILKLGGVPAERCRPLLGRSTRRTDVDRHLCRRPRGSRP